MEEASEDITKDYDSVGAIAKLASSDRYSRVMQVSHKIPTLYCFFHSPAATFMTASLLYPAMQDFLYVA